jgi:enoyl-CoA hydratase/carnithine racemase
MPDPNDDRSLLIEIDSGIATLTLNRPERRNMLEPTLFAKLARALAALDADEGVRVIVLTGAGRDFCAGADLGGGAEIFSKEAFERFETLSGDLEVRDVAPQRLLTPVIAAVNGTAAGGGLTLALQCDLMLVAEDATLALPFVRRGLVAERNAHWNLPRLVGSQRALELLLTGRKFSGSEAATLGLALRAVPRESVLAEAYALAREIAQNASPAAAAATKQLLHAALGESDPDRARDAEREVFQALGASDDCREALAALAEKRPARWRLAKRAVRAWLDERKGR